MIVITIICMDPSGYREMATPSTKIIKVRQNLRGVDTYQLSLFGVLFLLKLIRQNDINRLRHGLFNNDKSFLEYCDIIADNYRDAIPLIFRRWSLLKRILKTLQHTTLTL